MPPSGWSVAAHAERLLGKSRLGGNGHASHGLECRNPLRGAAMVSFMRIYVDASGDSHFGEVDIEYESADFVPPAPPVLMSGPAGASAYSFEVVPSGWHGDWHPVPQRLLAVYLSGSGEMTASDGETRPAVAGNGSPSRRHDRQRSHQPRDRFRRDARPDPAVARLRQRLEVAYRRRRKPSILRRPKLSR